MNRLKNAVGIPVREWADGPWSLASREKGGEDVNQGARMSARNTRSSGPFKVQKSERVRIIRHYDKNLYCNGRSSDVLLTFFFAANILRNWEYVKQIQRHLRDNYLNLTMPLWSTFIIGAANVMNMICAYWRSGGFNEVVFFLGLNSVMCTILLVIVGWAHWQNRGKPPLPKRSYLPQPAEKNESPTGLF